MKDKFIDGGSIYFRIPNEKDLKGNWYKWLNDPIVTRYQNKGMFPNTRERQKLYYDKMCLSETDVIFAIIEKKGNRHIGNVGLHKIDWIHRSAELGIMIGEKKSWGKGYGARVWRMITEYGFGVLNLHRIYAIVMEDNIAACACAESSGFKKEGRVRDVFYKNGKYLSIYYFNNLREEFLNRKNR